jgi:hypothetical protein
MSTVDPSVHLDYRGLKAAAIKMARLPECVQRAVIREHNDHSMPPKISGLFLLMRVLFVLPADARTTSGAHSDWQGPVFEAAKKTHRWDYQWPVHVHPEGGFLEIERCQNIASGYPYQAVREFHEWTTKEHFPMRSPAEIEALEIREAP